MVDITDADKLGMAALAASVSKDQEINSAKKADMLKQKAQPAKRRKITLDDVKSGRVSIGDANDEAVMGQGYKSGGMIDRAAIRGHTKGKIC
jgi:hypothetical protein